MHQSVNHPQGALSTQFHITTAANHLQCLHDEFNFTNTAAAEFDVAAFSGTQRLAAVSFSTNHFVELRE